ncbi:hypothetical protein [Ammoniphilus sp. 3BR4]|uniref:hypothetical protein n=1 Tax=Ammoniphilus sp. 3BR4 TaxID=3158265 RepID=UPI003465D071
MEINAQLIEEVILTHHTEERWRRRDLERIAWIQSPKMRKKSKAVRWLNQDYVDEELHPALLLLNEIGIPTQYSCAGVSALDEPEDHSLYAYVTLQETPSSTLFVHYLMEKMGHRVLIGYEPARKRYDLSSFFIQHNRSFCILFYHFALKWQQMIDRRNL